MFPSGLNVEKLLFLCVWIFLVLDENKLYHYISCVTFLSAHYSESFVIP